MDVKREAGLLRLVYAKGRGFSHVGSLCCSLIQCYTSLYKKGEPKERVKTEFLNFEFSNFLN